MRNPYLDILGRAQNQIRAHQKHAIQSRWRRHYKNKISRPDRPQLILRQAIRRAGLRYRPMVEVFNPYWKGRRGQPSEEGLPQWIDAVVWLPNRKPGAILLLYGTRNTPPRPRQRQAAGALQFYLMERGVPVLVVEDYPLIELEYMIRNWVREETE